MTNRINTASRRVVLKTIGAGMALGGPFAGTGAGSDAPTAGEETFREQLFTVLASTQKYRNVDAAKDDGYEELGVFAEPSLGHVFESRHWEGNEYTGPTDIAEPPGALFYAPIGGEDGGDGPDLVLAGIEYTAPGDRTSNPPDLFADENSSHDLKVTEEEGWHRSPDPEAHDVTGLHVWIHLYNPAGLFRLGHPYMKHLIDE